jgi:DNA-binding MurR/RpiR family transcriptional regulator
VSYESVNIPDAITPDNSMLTILDKVSDIIIRSLNNTRTLFANCESDQAMEAILHAKAVHFFAIGDATATCQWACFKFNRIGIPSFCYNDVVFQYEAAMRMTNQDVVIAMSASGRSQNVVKAVKLAKEAGAVTISITQTARSPLLRYTDISLITSGIDMTLGRDSVSKRISEFAIIEAFYLGAIAKGSHNYEFLLQNTITSSDLNK